MTGPAISLCILSWRGHDTLARSLPTYTDASLQDLVDEALLLLPEPEQRTIALGEAHGLTVHTTPTNLGIMGGFAKLAEIARGRLLLLLEDDCPLIEPRHEVARQLAIASRALTSGEVQAFRLRHRHFPGAAHRFFAPTKAHRYHPAPTADGSARAAARLRRLIRPGKARRMIGNLAYEGGDPYRDPYALTGAEVAAFERGGRTDEVLSAQWPDVFQVMPSGYLRAVSAVMPWSNQSVMVCRDFYLQRLVAYAAAHPSRRGAAPNLERELNGPYWRRSTWHVGLDRGLFTHELC